MISIVSVFVLFPNEIAFWEINFLCDKPKMHPKGELVKFPQNFGQANNEPIERSIKMLQSDTTTTL